MFLQCAVLVLNVIFISRVLSEGVEGVEGLNQDSVEGNGKKCGCSMTSPTSFELNSCNNTHTIDFLALLQHGYRTIPLYQHPRHAAPPMVQSLCFRNLLSALRHIICSSNSSEFCSRLSAYFTSTVWQAVGKTGICASTDNLDAMCSNLEMAMSRDCMGANGPWCCYCKSKWAIFQNGAHKIK